MEAKATLKNVRISPQKARLVLNLIRGEHVGRAFAYLDATHKKASYHVTNLLKSAIANAEQSDTSVDVDDLVVKAAFANEGPTLKRFRPRAMGRATRINKRTSHITVVVSDEE